MSFAGLQEKLLMLVLPLVLAPLVAFATQMTKRVWAWLDQQHAIVKQGVAFAYATGFSVLAGLIGVSLCLDGAATCDATGLDWRVILSWALGVAIHGWKSKPKPLE